MKRCPTCNKTFTDPNLSFCIDDGTPLVKVDASTFDSEPTLVSPSPSDANSRVTQSYGQGSAPSDWKGPVYQPPGSFVPASGPSKRRVWPWIVGIAAVLLIVAGFGIAAAVFIPKMMRAARSQNGNTTNANVASNQNSRSRSDNANSSAPVTNSNENTNANAAPDDNSQPPTDQEKVLADLKDIENEWTVANINADKKKLARILADDYVGTQLNGKIQGKADYLKDIERDDSIKHWDFQNLKLTLKGDRATLSGTVTLEAEGQDDVVLRFTDKFVWRDARWQAVGSEVSRVE